MKSIRINAKGIEESATTELDDAYAEFFERRGGRYSHTGPIPLTHHTNTPSPNDNDVIGTTTNGVIPIRGPWTPTEHNLDNFVKHLNATVKYSPGTWFCYSSYVPDSPQLTKFGLQYVLAIERTLAKAQWSTGRARPDCHLVCNSTYALQPDHPGAEWVRWSDLSGARLLTQNEYERLVKDDVQLQDYIQNLGAQYAAGGLKISGLSP